MATPSADTAGREQNAAAAAGTALAPFSKRIPLIVATAFFMETLDGSIITTALPAIAHTFGRPTLTLCTW